MKTKAGNIEYCRINRVVVGIQLGSAFVEGRLLDLEMVDGKPHHVGVRIDGVPAVLVVPFSQEVTVTDIEEYTVVYHRFTTYATIEAIFKGRLENLVKDTDSTVVVEAKSSDEASVKAFDEILKKERVK